MTSPQSALAQGSQPHPGWDGQACPAPAEHPVDREAGSGGRWLCLMNPTIRIGLVGDCDPALRAHAAIPMALHLVADEMGWTIQPAWLETGALTRTAASKLLEPFHGIWCVPGSPYRSMDGALRAIRFAREN